MREAMFYHTFSDDGTLTCLLCPHRCHLVPGFSGKCRVRKNIDGRLMSMNYAELTAINLDPIEKKPLFRFMSGTKTLSIGSYGCNFSCSYCQNYSISMGEPVTRSVGPERIIEEATELNVPSISYTYNEPVVYYEYVLETAKQAKKKGLANIMVTNGYIEDEPLVTLLPYMDAMNIDLKAFRQDAYRRFCGGDLEPVLNTIERAYQQCHIEITTLLVTDMHEKDELENMFRWIAGISPDIPLHLSRYFPSYKHQAPATPKAWLTEVKNCADQYLNYVYLGNIPTT